MYPPNEQADMIEVYAECQKNSKKAENLYAERYPTRIQPSRRTFLNIYKKFKERGSLGIRKSEREKRVTHEANEISVLARVDQDPHISSRQLARESGIIQTSILNILHRHKFHPFHVSLHQHLSETDSNTRIRFCQWAQDKIRTNNLFFHSVLFTDESSFTNRAQVNLHNMHAWSKENPHWLRQVDHQRQWTVNVWCGIIDDRIIGPHFIDGSLNGNKYAGFLKNTLGSLLEEIPLYIRQTMWYQQDGCPAHYSRVAKNELLRLFPNRWIGRGGPVNWPARSPDLTPLDFFLWGTLKEMVYKEVPTTPEDMQKRIITACAAIKSADIQISINSFSERLQHCINANGRHFEHLL